MERKGRGRGGDRKGKGGEGREREGRVGPSNWGVWIRQWAGPGQKANGPNNSGLCTGAAGEKVVLYNKSQIYKMIGRQRLFIHQSYN